VRFGLERQKLPGVVQNDVTGWRQAYRLGIAIKQSLPIFLFQLSDLGAYGGLRAQDFFSSAGKTSQPCNFDKRFEIV
jgi:hypothetical protein